MARLILAAKEQEKGRPRSAKELSSLSPVHRSKVDRPKGLTTEAKAAELFGVRPSVIRSYLVEPKIIRGIMFEADPTVYLVKNEVQGVLFLGAADAPLLYHIPRPIRLVMFKGPDVFTRLSEGVLD
jgi:hypothetical protein